MKNNKQAIMIKMIEKGDERPTIHQLSKETGIRYKNVYDIIKKLGEENLIEKKRIGNAFQCSLNKKIHPLIFDAEYERNKQFYLQNNDLLILYKKLKSLNFTFITLLFGSFARGTADKGSDIDIMVISESNREKEIERVFSILPLKIHYLFLTYEEFLSMAKSNQFSVVTEAVRNNIILIGIEDYYRLMENVGEKKDKGS